jgi:outer membrane protein assembly factor BamB
MLHLLLSLTLGAGALSNFPRDAGGRISQPALGVSFDGTPVVVVSAGDRLNAFRADGGTVSGFPFIIPDGELLAGAPAAADLDGSRRPSIAVVTVSGRVYLWSGGGVAAGFPVSLGARSRAGASFADVDGDGKLELVVGDEKGRVHAFKRNGVPARGFPIQGGRAAVTSSISSSSFGGGPSLAWGAEDGKVHVVSTAGKTRPGFPLTTAFAVTGAPVFADLDDDGLMDLVVGSQDFKLYAVDEKGLALPGFPVAAGYRIYESPAIADLDGDRRLDVVFASADGFLHAVDRTGKALKGFPVRVGPRLFAGPVVGDVDRDGALEVVVATADGAVAVVNGAGRSLTGFPASLGESDMAASPLLFDLAGDGTLAIFVGTPLGRLHGLYGLRTARGGTASVAAPWPGPARDAARSGRYGPNPPSYKNLKLTPEAPRLADSLQASWRAIWLDAGPDQAAPAPRLEWLRNGKPVPGLEGRTKLPPGTARLGERWRFSLAAAGGSLPSESAEVRVLDTAPSAPVVKLQPPVPERGTAVRAIIASPAVDPDGDAVTYRIEWLLDGLETGVTGETFPGDRLRKGLLLTARVVASDGELDSARALAVARVANTMPGPLVAALDPAAPRRTDTLRAQILKQATDVDGDKLAYRYRWTLQGKPLPLPLSAAEVPASLLRKHQRAKVEVRAFDGEAEGPPATAEAEIRNTPPGSPKVEILPVRPRKGEALRAILAAPAEDADADPVSYTFTWTKNGQPLPVSGDPREVPGTQVQRGDRFEVTVQAFDGEEKGPKATAVVTAVNTPPEPPRVAIEPRHPMGGQTLKLVVTTLARDADGDPVKLDVAWTRDGKPATTGAETLASQLFRKHERVRVIVTPTDGMQSGVPATDEVVVENAPPSAPTVVFGPAHPTVGEPLRAIIQGPANDPDGDWITYRYRWLRDGSPVQLPGGDGKQAAGWTNVNEAPLALLAKGQRWEVEVQAFDGEVHGPSGWASAEVVNSPPPPPEISFSPARPRTVDGLSLQVKQRPDPDGDQLTYRFTWTRNGARYEAPADQALIPRGVPRKGERWGVEVAALDGQDASLPVRAEVVIADTAPGPVAVALCDGPVPSGTVPEVRVTRGAVDPDGDAVTYRYEWSLNGSVLPQAKQARLGVPLKKRDVVRVQVTPWDGELPGPPMVASCAGRNTPPTVPVAVLEPATATALTGISVKIQKPATDVDGDAITYRYRWSRDGLPFALDGAALKPGSLRRGEVWRAEVTAFDGDEAGEPLVLTTVVANTIPPVPAVTLKPAAPSTGASLSCEAVVPERDADQEPIIVGYRWSRNGKLEPLAEGRPVLPQGVIRRGERWRCEVWASDGVSESPRASAEVTVQNSPPGSPQVAIEPELAHTGDELTCRVTVPSIDPDGDEVTYTYAWWQNDKPLPGTSESGRLPTMVTTKRDRFKCAATPSDGTAKGRPAAAERVISNAPPGPARATLAPATPRVGQPIRCEVTSKSVDPDGDLVHYRFRWQRNGAPQPFAETSEEVPVRMLRAGDRWRCIVVPTDGDLDGPESGSEEAPVEGPP